MHFTTEPHETAEGRRIILVLVNRLRIEGTFEFVKLEPAEGNAFTAEPSRLRRINFDGRGPQNNFSFDKSIED
jgi:hypothetical protein